VRTNSGGSVVRETLAQLDESDREGDPVQRTGNATKSLHLILGREGRVQSLIVVACYGISRRILGLGGRNFVDAGLPEDLLLGGKRHLRSSALLNLGGDDIADLRGIGRIAHGDDLRETNLRTRFLQKKSHEEKKRESKSRTAGKRGSFYGERTGGNTKKEKLDAGPIKRQAQCQEEGYRVPDSWKFFLVE
jgi:hypothetical protein